MQVYDLWAILCAHLVFSSAHKSSERDSSWKYSMGRWTIYLSLTLQWTTFIGKFEIGLAVEKNRQMSLAAAMHC